MPIKPENKNLYPSDWPDISARIRTRDKNRCKFCKVRQYAVGWRDKDGRFYPLGGNVMLEDYGQGIDAETGGRLTFKKAREIAIHQTEMSWDGTRYIVIVLTVAHLDHNPENCTDENLAALCQWCHNRYDRSHRNQTIRNNKLKGQMNIDL